MIYNEHPKSNIIIIAIVTGIAALIIIAATLPFLKNVNDFIKGILITAGVIGVGYPVVKYYFKSKQKKSNFEQRTGRKLK